MGVAFGTWVAALLIGLASGEPVITGRSPYWMGHAGGVTLTVTGSGFSEDMFSQFDPTLGNIVKLVNDAETIDCEVINYLSNTNKIVCNSGPRTNTAGSGIYYIQVFSDGVQATGTQTVEYADWVAPKIDSVTPRWALGRTVVEFGGWMQATTYRGVDPADPLETGSDSGVILTKVYMGGVECEMVNETSGALYQLESRSLKCLVTSKYTGPMNGTTYVTERGVSVNRKWGIYVDSQDRLFQHHTYAGVESVSPSSGSTQGNTLLTVTGVGFDPYPGKTEVWVGGAECVIQDVQDETLTCLTPSQSVTGPASGERGILSETWSGVYVSDLRDDSLWAPLDSSHSGYSSSVMQDTTITVDGTQNLTGRVSGYLHVAHDGLYSLSVGDLDGNSDFFVAENGNPDNKTYVGHWQHITLEADTPAYFELRYRTMASMTFRIRMADFNAKFTYDQTAIGHNELQRVRLDPKEQFEVQRISYSGSPGQARIYLAGFTSDLVDITVDTEIRSAILGLTDQQCDIQADSPTYLYQVDFEMGEDDLLGVRGSTVVDFASYCGKKSYVLNTDDPRLFYTDEEDEMADVNTYRYMCFAIRGNIETTMKVQFRWKDKNGRTGRTDQLTVDHGFASTADAWAYGCIDLIALVENSWINNDRNAGDKLKVRHVLAPRRLTYRDNVYVDTFAFSTENINVIQTRPSALKNAGILVDDVVVTAVENEPAFDVEFQTGNCAGNFPLLGVTETSGDASWITDLASAASYTFSVGAEQVNVSRTFVATHPAAGTWSLNIEGATVEDIPFDVTDWALDEMIEAALGTSGMLVTRYGICTRYDWYIEWKENPGLKELSSIDDSGLTFDGEKITSFVDRRREGKLWHDPIEGDFLTVRSEEPQVFVRVNGYSAACTGSCGFTFDDSGAPSLSSVTGSPDASGSHTLTIVGTGFSSSDNSDYSVTVGGSDCTVSAVTTTQVTCTVAYLPAGVFPVAVSMNPVGGALQPDPPLSYTVTVTVTSVTPATGGTGGGYSVVVAGTGFPADLAGWESNSVALGLEACDVIAADATSVTCTAPAGTGVVDVSVTVGGVAASLSSAFTYDASLSATLTSVSPTTSSVLGGELLTITGSGFGSGTDGRVMVGDEECEPDSWADASITCTLPALSPGAHPVTVFTNSSMGFASGSASVTYTLKVTSYSSATGSVYGGSIMVIRGEGFGSNCSLLQIDLGDGVMCDVEECSDTEVTCTVMVMPRTHVVRNNGINTVHGPGYAWNPKLVVVREGDSVKWEWTKSDPLSQLMYNVFQTSSGASIEYDGSGFNSGAPTSSGSYIVTFPHRGTYFYAGTPIANNVVLSGKVEVLKPAQKAYKVTLSLGGIEAEFVPDGAAVSVSVDGCSPILETAVADCNSTAPDAPDADALYFITDMCFTASVTGVSASATQNVAGLSGLQVAGGATLTLTGSGLGESTCQTEVWVGDASCTVTASSDTSVTCNLDDYDSMVSLQPFPLVVNVINRGIACLDVPDFETTGQVSIVPVVTSFSPVEGSLEGGTVVTIQGTGLEAFDGQATVLMGSYPCVVSEVTPTDIICITTAAPAGAVNMVVRISAYNIDAVSNLASSVFTYSTAATPSVTSVSQSGSSLTITGSAFGTNFAAVTVTLTVTSSRRKRSIPDEMPEDPAPVRGHFLVADERSDEVDQDMEGVVRDSYKPVVHTGLFDDMGSDSHFWGTFTKTNARNFEESKALGAWRIGGSKRVAKVEAPVALDVREKREASQTSYECSPTSVTDTTIVCNTASLPAGSYDISLSVDGLGDASVDSGVGAVTTAPIVSTISPTEGSVNGGALLTISGASFTLGNLNVTVDGLECQILSEAIDTITCLTPVHAAGVASVAVTSGGVTTNSPTDFTYDSAKTPVLSSDPVSPIACCNASISLSGTNLKLATDDPEVTVGGVACTEVVATSTTVTCKSPELASGTYDIVVRDVLYGYSNSISVTYSFSVDSVSPSSGGFGGVEATLTGTGFDPAGGSTVTVCDATCDVTAASFGSIKCVVPPRTPGGSSTESCDVVVTNPDATTTTLVGGFTYDSSLSSSVTVVSPVRGGTAGGTDITITGTGFADTGNAVTIGGSVCNILTESSTVITCKTTPHSGPGEFPVMVTVPGKGIATVDENGEFFYIDRWSSVFTWGGLPVPSEGQLVIIENGQTVLMDESTEVLEMLLIKGGHVVFDQEATSEIVLRAKYILVVEGGSLSIGSEEEPFMGDAVIELYGDTKTIELPNYGAKVLAVREGRLDLHGAPIEVTWTHLATTAAQGSTTITLKQPVTWKAGDNIVIATTERRFMVNENEERTIASVSADGLTLTLTEPLDFEHISIEQTFGSHVVETRAEVGLLTRNIKIRGNINSDFIEEIEACDEDWHPGQFKVQSCFNGRFGEEIGGAQFGATVMLFGKEANKDLVQGRVEYVEVTEAGQAFQLGRYPLHFHLVGNVNTSYIRGCAVHRTYNRAVTIHAADYLTVERNVVYNNMGHAIFTEDGVEQFNVIQYNLAVYTRSSSSLLNVDITPSAYWVVHPNNIVRHNAAAGGTHFGYWYRLERHPSGPSATNSICQNNAPIGEFTNNTAHSMGWYGLWVFSMDGYFPKSNECWGSNLVAKWDGFTTWRNERGAEIVFGGQLQFHNFVALDNEFSGIEMVKMDGGFGLDNGPGVFNSVIIGHSALTPEGCGDATSGIIAPKKSVFSIADTEFYNFDTNKCTALSGCSQCKVFQGGYQVQVKGLTFVNSPNKLKFLWEHETVWIDADGSLSGVPENKVVPDSGILPPACTKSVAAFSLNPEAPGAVCPSSVEFVRLTVKGTNVKPQSFRGGDLVLSDSYGNTTIPYRVKRLDGGEGWMAILPTAETYDWMFEDGEPQTDIEYEAQTKHMQSGQYYYVQHRFMQTPDSFSTTGVERNSSDSLPDPVTGFHGEYYWDDSAKTMTYLVSDQVESRKKRTVFDERRTGSTRNINFETYRCEYEGCIPPTPPPVPTGRPDVTFLWSDVETWKEVPVGSGGHPTEEEYGLPVEGDEIIIPPGVWIIVDTDTPSLGRVYVYGGLEFADTMDHVFNATIIFLQGGSLVAGFSEDAPFTHKLNIVLRGTTDPNDPDNVDMPMPDGTPDVGWKAMGVFGQLILNGQCPSTTWVKLGATAAAGETVVTLAEAADSSWLNKEVMITTTGKEPTETEVRMVTAVSGNTLTLDAPLIYEHLGETHTLSDGTQYVMAGEVGLLTHQIVIEGSDYAGLNAEGFGGRVLVSTLTSEGVDYQGSAQLSCVEFKNMGQKDFSESTDPRFSIAFHSLGTDDGSNYLKKCSFNKNFNSAIGFFSSNNFVVENNVVYYTVGSSIVDEGETNSFRYNLVSLLFFPGTYNGEAEDQYQPWEGGFYLNKATGTVLEGNVVAGSELAGYRTYGELCDESTNWIDNEVHGATYGVMVWKKGQPVPNDCRRINNFYAWRITDTAFYMQSYASLHLTNVVSADSRIGTNQLVYAPPALSHMVSTKTATTDNSLFIGASPSYDCTYHNSTSNAQNFFTNLWTKGIDGGNAGVMLAAFVSGINMAPKHAFHEASAYPAINGATYISNVKFANYATRTCGKDVAMISNKDADDAIHPVFVSGLTFLDTSESNKLFLFEPNLGRVNPSDCVDMDCDGHKKVIITDMDGTFLGAVDATATSQAEFEWDGDPSRGIGDYRIPISLRQKSDGSAFTPAEKFPKKGIIRDDSCTLMTEWRAWKCTNFRHRMMVIESMDSDTEIRRLSPIGLIANPGVNGYVDLLNGPMDRGWCFGYTCQERISTFYAVVATGHVYEMAMTSTPPQVIRFHLLHTDPSEAVLLRMYFPKTQRYDISVDGVYIPPTNIDNSKYPAEYQLLPENDLFLPSITDPVGTNYLQRNKKLLHVVLRGGSVIDITTTPTIILSMGIVIDPDNFFEENLVQNLALLLNIPPENIRVTNIISESSGRRRKRATEDREVEFEIASPPMDSSNSSSGISGTHAEMLTRADLDDIMEEAVNTFQSGVCHVCNFTISSLKVSPPLKEPEVPTGYATPEFGQQIIQNGTLYSNLQQQEDQLALNQSIQGTAYEQPSASAIEQAVPITVKALTPFPDQPVVVVLSDDGNPITDLGRESEPWRMTALLSGGDSRAVLLGNTTVSYLDGAATFTNLGVSRPGLGYSLTFMITSPDSAPDLSVALDQAFVVEPKSMKMQIEAPEYIVINQDFSLNIVLIDRDTGNMMDSSMLVGQTISGLVKSKKRARLQGATRFTFQDEDVASFSVDGLRVGKALRRFRLSVKSNIAPAGIAVNGVTDLIPVLDFEMPVNATVTQIRMRVKGINSKGVKNHVAMFENKAMSEIQNIGNVLWQNPELKLGRKLVFSVEIKGGQAERSAAIESLCMKLKTRKIKFKINRRTVWLERMKVDNGKWFKCKVKRFIEVKQYVGA
ncbi:putative fibrocystin-L [Penaeus vannamei]|uniref:Putative fibrocystin-L n=1 Tax=Penaeus vannamei TaxID=6689 RepID=A0A423SMH2_PENVA|nr:fibrocystin-L-like [Penaeus vannamei]ROT65416.1 putative fibrocystin-L [Penaeus vannamei]